MADSRSIVHMPNRNLFLAPCASDRPQEHFRRTVRDGVTADIYREHTAHDYGDSIGVWGLVPNLESTWKKLSAGDYVVFYWGNKQYKYSAEVVATEHNPDLAKELWPAYADESAGEDDPADPWECIVYLDEPREIDIDSRDLQGELLGEGKHFTMRFRPVNDEGLRTIRNKFGSVKEYIEEHTVTTFDDYVEDTSNTESPSTDGAGAPDRPEPDHPLFDHLNSSSERSIFKITAPPDFWLTVIEHCGIPLGGDYGEMSEISKGDILLFHSTQTPMDDQLSERDSKLFGVVVAGRRAPKERPWTWEERRSDSDTQFSAFISFTRLFLTGTPERINANTPIEDRSAKTRETELDGLLRNGLSAEQIDEICDQFDVGFPYQETLVELSSGEQFGRGQALLAQMAPELTEHSSISFTADLEGEVQASVFDGLHFPDGETQGVSSASELAMDITAALRSGKHIVFTGPPGTGKTEIASRVSDYLVENHPNLYTDRELTTATADWSTFDTIGGYMPESENDTSDSLEFSPGLILNRFKNRRTGQQLNEPVIIDELNHSDIDKAFGQLFTLLSGQSVTLPYTKNSQEIELLAAAESAELPAEHQYVVPQSWRIFATMNTYDKTSLYEMSYAFMRRFAFIRIPAPALPDGTSREEEEKLEQIVFDFADVWALSPEREEAMSVGRVWREANHAVDDRAIGPAIVEDMLRYISQHPGNDLGYILTQAVVSYLLPQLEGVPKRKKIVRKALVNH